MKTRERLVTSGPARGRGARAAGRARRRLDQGRTSGHPGGGVRRAGAGQHARRRACAQRRQLPGRRQEDRDHQGLVRRLARQRGEGGPQARRAGRGENPDRTAVRRRRARGQGLRQDPAERHLHQRHLRRSGHDAARPGPELLPLHHRRRAMDGGTGRVRLQRQEVSHGRRPSPKTTPSRTPRCSASWRGSARPAGMCRRSSGCRSATRTSPLSSPRSPTTSTRSMSRSAARTESISSPSTSRRAARRR